MKIKNIKKDRLKGSEIAEARALILKSQGYCCALCGIDLRTVPPKQVCLDHSHATGFVRGVLCINCNQQEGRVHNSARRAKRGRSPYEWLVSLIEYWEYHAANCTGIYHPSHRSLEEKRIKRNKKAKKRRLQKKKARRLPHRPGIDF